MKILEIIADGNGTVIDVGGRKVRVVKSRMDQRYPLVLVDVAKFDQGFARDAGFYVGPSGSDAAIGNRYQRFMDYLRDHSSVEASAVSVDETGRVAFTDGRHRYAVLRDLGVRQLPVVVLDGLENARSHGYVIGDT